MRRMATGMLAGLGLTLALGMEAQAAPDGGDEDALVRHAILLRRRGDDRDAQIELQRAYDVAHSPRVAAQLGFAEQAIGMWPQAEAHVGEALRAPDDPWIRRNRATLEEALVTIRAHVGRVEIVGGVPGAQVTIAGQPVGRLPLPGAVAVSAGPVEIEVQAPGFEVAVRTVNVAAGEYARVPITLRAHGGVGMAPPRAVAPVQPVGGGALVAPPALQVDRKNPPRDEGRGRRYAGVGLVAGGLAAVGGGVAASLVAKHKFDAINGDAAADLPYNPTNGNWKTYETAATALYFVGAGALIGGAVLYVSGRSRGENAGQAGAPPVSVSLKPQVAPGRAGGAISVRF